jgi:predicted anti-sigma-YlaC factor YlaD
MRCTRFREAVSARIDGEDPGLPTRTIDAHLAECPDCRSWADAAVSPALRSVASPDDPNAIQVALAWPGGFLDDGHASIHLAHELTAWDMGLAAGFLVVAWRPARAWGMLPLVGVLVAAMVVTSGFDLVWGHALLGRETVHALALAGLGCVWALARRAPRSSVVVRVA